MRRVLETQGEEPFSIRLRRVLASLACTFLLYGGGGGVGEPDDVFTSISFRGYGCVFLTLPYSLTKLT